MTRWVALLYSVVITPTRRLTSADLLAVAGAAGLANARTVLASGNLLFDATGSEAALEVRIAAAVGDVLGRPIPVFLRSAADLAALLAANPFPAETAADATRVAVRVMRALPAPPVLERIAAAAGPGERFTAGDRAIWVATAGLPSASRLARAAGATWAGEGTFRNASAIARIAAALG